ncbi:entericidin EcnAB [Rhodobacteraceae bacterium WD3A24]|nr:entericidin EcnAB [Rhodobacteraceae bacterium WD3A24]
MKLATPMLALLGLLGLAACETVEGAGRDLQRAGQTVEREAQTAR